MRSKRGASKAPSRGANFRNNSRANFSRRRGESSGKRPALATKKDPFYSTRVEEQYQDSASENEILSQQDSHDSIDVSELSDSSSDSNYDSLPHNDRKAHDILVASLGAAHDSGGPKPKRQKLEGDQAPLAVDVIDKSIPFERGSEADVDAVSEAETVEDFETDSDGNLEETNIEKDPFTRHISDVDEAALTRSIEDVSTWTNMDRKLPTQQGWVRRYQGGSQQPSMAPKGGNPSILSIEQVHLKEKLKGPGRRLLPQMDEIMSDVATAVFNYNDVLFPQRTQRNADTLREISCLHALNHLFKTRDTVIKNNARLARTESTEDLEFRDQGFTRPKVLIVLPTRQSCVRYIDTIISFCKPEQQENKKRFQDSYANGSTIVSESKPTDFQELFDGNDDDLFRLGLKFTRKTIKFFSQFYNSDIIFASPLGLRMALGADDPKKQDHDFLSSIEVVIVDQAEAIAMQNWEHMEYIFERLNLQPKEAHGCDFSRVRHWYLDGRAKYLRQTILLSAFNFPTLNKVYIRSMLNVAGKSTYVKMVEGAMVDIGLASKHTFSRFVFKSSATEPDDRFEYFSTTVVPSLSRLASHRSGSSHGVLLFIPSYADFVRIRNYLASSADTQNISFGSVSEYTSVSEVARARSHFLSGRHSLLLYTERAHHFRRYNLKGVKQVVMYALPENPIFYNEIVGGYLQASIMSGKVTARETSMRALFSKLDVMKLERIVGTSRLSPMLKDKSGDTFEFE